MKLTFNKPVDLTAQLNDTFYTESTSEFYDKNNLWDLYRMEASLNFKPTTDFRTMAEVTRFDNVINIRYNWQLAIVENKRIIINLN